MHPTNRWQRSLLGGLLLIGFTGMSGVVTAQVEPLPPPQGQARTGQTLVVPINGTEFLRMSKNQRIQEARNQDPNVARVQTVPTDPTSVVVTGLASGRTNVLLIGEDGAQETIEVTVLFDVEYLSRLIERTVPTANIKPVPAAGNTIILTGNVAHSEDVQTILRVAQSVVGNPELIVDAMRVGGVMQVQLEVVIALVNRRDGRAFGLNYIYSDQVSIWGNTSGNVLPLAGVGRGLLPPGPGAYPDVGGVVGGLPVSNLYFGLLYPRSGFLSFMQALRNEGLAKILAEPKVVTLSGRPATFLSGGQQPIPELSGLGATGFTLVPFGTQVTFLPIVLGNGRIYLEVEPSISELDAAAGTTVALAGGATTTIFGRNEQRVRTSVIMEDGQTFAIGGLIQRSATATTAKVPLLGEIPFLGVLFSQKEYSDTEREVLVLVTPRLVDPLDCAQAPCKVPGMETRKPDDFELFLEGIIEAPRGQRKVFHGHRYVPAYMNDSTSQKFPCNVPPEVPFGINHPGAHGMECVGGSCGGVCAGVPCHQGSMPPPATALPTMPNGATNHAMPRGQAGTAATLSANPSRRSSPGAPSEIQLHPDQYGPLRGSVPNSLPSVYPSGMETRTPN
ncbi:MAG: type II and III secretion system protein family protein [Gemmataceae bacterium]